jgi:hypothetical protein
MIRTVRDALAFVAVGGFIWMMCSVAHLAA